MSGPYVAALVEQLRKLPHVAAVRVVSEDPLRLELTREGKRYPLVAVFPWQPRELPELVRVDIRNDYSFTQYSYIDLPGSPSSGSFILLTNPDASVTEDAKQMAAAANVQIGNVKDLTQRIAQMPRIPSRWPARLGIGAVVVLLSPILVVVAILGAALWVLLSLADFAESLWKGRDRQSGG